MEDVGVVTEVEDRPKRMPEGERRSDEDDGGGGRSRRRGKGQRRGRDRGKGGLRNDEEEERGGRGNKVSAVIFKKNYRMTKVGILLNLS